MKRYLLPAFLAILGLVLQTTGASAEEVTRVPLSSAEIEAYQSIASGNVEHLTAGAMSSGDIVVAALVALGILFLVLIIV